MTTGRFKMPSKSYPEWSRRHSESPHDHSRIFQDPMIEDCSVVKNSNGGRAVIKCGGHVFILGANNGGGGSL